MAAQARLIRPFALALGIGALSLAAPAQELRRAAPAEAQVISGAYELANEAGTRKCILLLRPSDAPGGYALGFPAQCRMALPVLARVTAWTVETMQQAPRARITLINSKGEPVLDFKDEGPSGGALTRDATGQTYLLKPSQGSSLAHRVDSLIGARPAARVVYNPPLPDLAAMARGGGTFALLRAEDKDTGCLLTLEPPGPAAADGAAKFIEKCPDKGIAYFAPKSWNIAGDSLWLIGTRGRISFNRNRKGGWDKAPGQGEPLFLQKR